MQAHKGRRYLSLAIHGKPRIDTIRRATLEWRSNANRILNANITISEALRQMSTRAYVLIETAVGETDSVSTALDALPGVQSVDTVTGPYDIIAMVSARDLNAVGQIVTREVHTVPGIVRTVTCMVVGG